MARLTRFERTGIGGETILTVMMYPRCVSTVSLKSTNGVQ
jgi:uncharacterized protein with PQ loop repeat